MKGERVVSIRHDGNRRLDLTVIPGSTSDYVANEIFNRNCYAPLPFVKGVSSIVDVGANIGLAAGYFRISYPDARIYCFEPDPDALALLKRNAQVIGNCVVSPCGLFSENVTKHLHLGRDGPATSSIHKHGFSAEAKVDVCLVDARDVFSELTKSGPIDILKIDTEGCELQILQRARSHIAGIRVLYLEFHSESDRREIDDLIIDTHTLWKAAIESPHRGLLTYVERSLMANNVQNGPL